MRREFFAVVLFSLVVSACGSDERASPAAKASAAAPSLNLDHLPATVEGVLEVVVEEGDEDDEGSAEFVFADLKVGSKSIPIQLNGAVLKRAGVPAEGGRVRVTLGSKSTQYGPENYVVTAVEKL
ncbi:MAG: hypothetical protein ABI411_09985 [Tahibacter sp.]